MEEYKTSTDGKSTVYDISMLTISKQDVSIDSYGFTNEHAQRENDNDGCLELAAHLYLNEEVEVNCDEEQQTIEELIRSSGGGKLLETSGHSNSMRLAFGVMLRLVLPLTNGVARGLKGIRDVRFLRVLRNITSSRQALMNLVSFAVNMISMNLSSVQVTHRIDPLLKLMKIPIRRECVESLPDIGVAVSADTPCGPEEIKPLQYFPTAKRKLLATAQLAPACCTLNVLAEPPTDVLIRADIVLIHGLHGSLANTWKQGLWENDRPRSVEFERPPKPAVRPPKRLRYSRSVMTHPTLKQKRARFTRSEEPRRRSCCENSQADFDECCNSLDLEAMGEYLSDETKEDDDDDDAMEYSFPTFRLRINDNGTLHSPKQEPDRKDNDDSADKEKEQPTNENKHKERQSLPKSAKDPNYSLCWPGDWLPLDCPGVRVIALNYTTDQYLWRPLWKKKEERSSLRQRAREMEELLIKYRVGYGHPIVWVAHSKGGIFVKQIIVDAWESRRPAMSPLWRSSRGTFFYSVPHRGSHLASIKAPFLTRSVELIDIEKNSKYLLDLHRRFVGLYHLGHLRIEVFSFIEMSLTLMSVLYLRIVGIDSADPGIGEVCGMRLDHREICKPRSRDCILYTELVKMIKKVY